MVFILLVIVIIIVAGFCAIFGAVTENKGIYCYETYLSYILRWSPKWLNDITFQPHLLHQHFCVNNRRSLPVQERYESLSQYEEATLPWLLEETWENIKQDEQERLKTDKGLPPEKLDLYVIEHVKMTNSILFKLRCQIIILDNDNRTLPRFDDLLLVTNHLNQTIYGLQQEKQPIFKKSLIHPSLISQLNVDTICFELIIWIAENTSFSINKLPVKVQVVTSLVSNLRRFRALASLTTFQITKQLLSPKFNDQLFSIPRRDHYRSNLSENTIVNETQQQVIDEATSIVCDDSAQKDKIYMIQGPPGTGKSYTIVNIIKSIAQRWKYDQRRKKLKILVCAPSNGACNEIARKLLDHSDGLKIVRMGRDEGLSVSNEPRLQRIILETFVEQILNAGPSLSAKDRAKYAKGLKNLKMEEADIIICTLNYAGNFQFDPFRVTQPNQSSPFDCLIVDEASQCLELDIFIPLRLGIRRILLVGDPEQLPPTILSKNAQNAKFGQSLMERLYSLFKSNDLIRMLNVQYRMAEEICRFPSTQIYAGRLLTDVETQRKRSEFRLKPYVFIDVPESLAILDAVSQSYSNPIEADCINRLYRFLTRITHIDIASIGIITPYKQQVKLLKHKIKEQIDIGTVDGFQGREKGIILLSTVRAHRDGAMRPSIGFVADRRRLNVSLTRGKFGMYIIGHIKSLKINRDWNALIDDADERGCIWRYSTKSSFNWLKRT